MTLFVAPIVEGHTEQSCVDRLLHRIWEMLQATERLQVLTATRGNRDEILDVQKDALNNKVEQALLKLGQSSQKELQQCLTQSRSFRKLHKELQRRIAPVGAETKQE